MQNIPQINSTVQTQHPCFIIKQKSILISHLFATVDQPLLLRRDPFFLLHPFFNALHLYGNKDLKYREREVHSQTHTEKTHKTNEEIMVCMYLICGLYIDFYLLACECLRIKEMGLFKLNNNSVITVQTLG